MPFRIAPSGEVVPILERETVPRLQQSMEMLLFDPAAQDASRRLPAMFLDLGSQARGVLDQKVVFPLGKGIGETPVAPSLLDQAKDDPVGPAGQFMERAADSLIAAALGASFGFEQLEGTHAGEEKLIERGIRRDDAREAAVHRLLEINLRRIAEEDEHRGRIGEAMGEGLEQLAATFPNSRWRYEDHQVIACRGDEKWMRACDDLVREAAIVGELAEQLRHAHDEGRGIHGVSVCIPIR